MESVDFVVIGAGVAGASAAWRLAAFGRVALLEQEERAGYHTTGRSAALYSKRYKNPLIRGLAIAAGSLLESPPDGFSDHAILTPRGLLVVGREDQTAALDAQFTPEQIAAGIAAPVSIDEARELVPVLDPGYVAGALYVERASDIDVHALHGGFLRGLAAAGGRLVSNAEAQAIRRVGPVWEVETPAGTFQAPVVVNAAGAWADTVAERAGLPALGLVPKRRTCVTFDPPAELDPRRWPMVMGAEEDFYFKPEAGRVLASPCDETVSPPCDSQAEEIDVAEAVDRVEKATSLRPRRLTHRWAGLRCFLPDKMPVAGEDPAAPGFVWVAGLGGFGIMTSEALGRAAAAAATGSAMPSDLAGLGIAHADLSPTRLRG